MYPVVHDVANEIGHDHRGVLLLEVCAKCIEGLILACSFPGLTGATNDVVSVLP